MLTVCTTQLLISFMIAAYHAYVLQCSHIATQVTALQEILLPPCFLMAYFKVSLPAKIKVTAK